MHTKTRLKVLLSRAMPEALRQLFQLRTTANSPWRQTCTPGHMRGIDFYSTWQLIWAFAHALYRYRKKFGHFPSAVHPTTFNEKVLWFKFFGELRVPYAGDKLATSLLVPSELRSQVAFMPVIWESTRPELPANDAIAPGIYYLKANLGTGMFARVEFPLSDEQRQELEVRTRRWLAARPGLDRGEWWYNTFEPKIFMERSVTGDKDSISWNFFVLNGQIPMISLFTKHYDGSKSSTWVDTNFQPLPTQSILPAVENFTITNLHHQMLALAQRIGSDFSAVRVDFLEGHDGKIYLCEMTYSPGDGMTKRSVEADALLTEPWKVLR